MSWPLSSLQSPKQATPFQTFLKSQSLTPTLKQVFDSFKSTISPVFPHGRFSIHDMHTFHTAVENGDTETLLGMEATLHEMGAYPIELALAAGSLKATELLLEMGLPVSQKALQDTLASGLPWLNLLIRHKRIPPPPNPFWQEASKASLLSSIALSYLANRQNGGAFGGEPTALDLNVVRGRPDRVKALIQMGHQPTTDTLSCAIWAGDWRLVQILRQAGAPWSAQQLSLAALLGNTAVLEALMDEGLTPDSSTLTTAYRANQYEMVLFLESKGVRLDDSSMPFDTASLGSYDLRLFQHYLDQCPEEASYWYLVDYAFAQSDASLALSLLKPVEKCWDFTPCWILILYEAFQQKQWRVLEHYLKKPEIRELFSQGGLSESFRGQLIQSHQVHLASLLGSSANSYGDLEDMVLNKNNEIAQLATPGPVSEETLTLLCERIQSQLPAELCGRLPQARQSVALILYTAAILSSYKSLEEFGIKNAAFENLQDFVERVLQLKLFYGVPILDGVTSLLGHDVIPFDWRWLQPDEINPPHGTSRAGMNTGVFQQVRSQPEITDEVAAKIARLCNDKEGTEKAIKHPNSFLKEVVTKALPPLVSLGKTWSAKQLKWIGKCKGSAQEFSQHLMNLGQYEPLLSAPLPPVQATRQRLRPFCSSGKALQALMIEYYRIELLWLVSIDPLLASHLDPISGEGDHRKRRSQENQLIRDYVKLRLPEEFVKYSLYREQAGIKKDSVELLLKFLIDSRDPLRVRSPREWNDLQIQYLMKKYSSYSDCIQGKPTSQILNEFMEAGLRGEKLDEALDLTSNPPKNQDHLPNLRIRGPGGMIFEKLAANDHEGLILGVHFNCCQHIDGEARKPTLHGFSSPYGGFYRVRKPSRSQDRVAMSWAGLTSENELLFDSIEHLGRDQEDILLMYRLAATQILLDHPDIPRVLIGKGGGTEGLFNDTKPLPAWTGACSPIQEYEDGSFDAKKGRWVLAQQGQLDPELLHLLQNQPIGPEKGELVNVKGVDTWLVPGRKIKVVTWQNRQRAEFWKAHPKVHQLLMKYAPNPLVEEGFHTQKQRERRGELGLTAPAIYHLIEKRLKPKIECDERYQIDHILFAVDDPKKLRLGLSAIDLKPGQNGLIAYGEHGHASLAYLENGDGCQKVFIMDPEGHMGHSLGLLHGIQDAFPKATVYQSNVRLQTDYASCTTVLFYFMKQLAKRGKALFAELEQNQEKVASGTVTSVSAQQMPAWMFKIAQDKRVIPESKLEEEVSARKKVSLREHLAEMEVLIQDQWVNTHLIQARYRYFHALEGLL